jgi:hypothetical protein
MQPGAGVLTTFSVKTSAGIVRSYYQILWIGELKKGSVSFAVSQ